MLSLLLVLLPATVLSEFTINIIRGSEPKFKVTGSDVDIISDVERGTFGIQDSELKDAVYSFYHDRPDEVFVKEPTSEEELYKKHGWSEIKRILNIKGVKVVNKESVKTIMSSRNYVNEDTKSITFPVEVLLEVNNSVNHVTTRPSNVAVDHKTIFHVDVVNDVPNLIIKNDFLKGNIVTKTLGFKSPTKVTVSPGNTAVAVLVATRDKINLEIEYEISLQGSVAVKFGSRFKVPLSWAMDINEVLGSTKPKRISWIETVDLDFYADESVLLYELSGKRIN